MVYVNIISKGTQKIHWVGVVRARAVTLGINPGEGERTAEQERIKGTTTIKGSQAG